MVARKSLVSLIVFRATVLLVLTSIGALVLNYTDLPLWIALKSKNYQLLAQFAHMQGTRALPYLARALHSEGMEERRMVVLSLGHIEPKPIVEVRLLIGALDDPSISVKALALDILASLGSAAADAVPKLSLLLDDPNNIVRIGAVQAIGSIRPDADQVVNKLDDMIRNDIDPDVRERAVWALAVIRGGRRR